MSRSRSHVISKPTPSALDQSDLNQIKHKFSIKRQANVCQHPGIRFHLFLYVYSHPHHMITINLFILIPNRLDYGHGSHYIIAFHYLGQLLVY